MATVRLSGTDADPVPRTCAGCGGWIGQGPARIVLEGTVYSGESGSFEGKPVGALHPWCQAPAEWSRGPVAMKQSEVGR